MKMCFYNVYYYLFIHYKDSLCLLASTFHVYDDDLVMLSSLPGCVGGISLTHCFSNLSMVLCSHLCLLSGGVLCAASYVSQTSNAV